MIERTSEKRYVSINVLLPPDLADWLDKKAGNLGTTPEELLSNILHEMIENKDKIDKAIELFKKAFELEEELSRTYKQIMELYGLKDYSELSDLRMKLLIFAAATTPPEEMRKIIAREEER